MLASVAPQGTKLAYRKDKDDKRREVDGPVAMADDNMIVLICVVPRTTMLIFMQT